MGEWVRADQKDFFDDKISRQTPLLSRGLPHLLVAVRQATKVGFCIVSLAPASKRLEESAPIKKNA